MDSCSGYVTSGTEVDNESTLKTGNGGGLFCIKALLFYLEMTVWGAASLLGRQLVPYSQLAVVFQLDSVSGKEHCSFFPSLLVPFEDCFKHVWGTEIEREVCKWCFCSLPTFAHKCQAVSAAHAGWRGKVRAGMSTPDFSAHPLSVCITGCSPKCCSG